MNINENDLARRIAIREGKLISLPIGQIKEVLSISLSELALESDDEILKLINKHRIINAAVKDVETGSDTLSDLEDLPT
jgi:hypothetical protein